MSTDVTIEECYMKGNVPTKANGASNDYGGIIGTQTSGTLSLNTVWYNQTFPWITNATNWNGTPKPPSNVFDTPINTIITTINNNIGI